MWGTVEFFDRVLGCQMRREQIVPTLQTGWKWAWRLCVTEPLGLLTEEGTNCSHLAGRLDVRHRRVF